MSNFEKEKKLIEYQGEDKVISSKEALEKIKKINLKLYKFNSKIPDGPLAQKWTKYKAAVKLVSPANKKRLDIIVVGAGAAGASAAASLAELGYNV